ncbi:MAG: 50S ribosomal protein L5 [Candidatus Altiarchaeota archaeon]
MNVMNTPRIEKLVVNIGVGQSGERLIRAEKLLEKFSSRKPVRTTSKHKIPVWGLRKGEPIGCKVTIRGEDAVELIKRGLYARDNKLPESCFGDDGNVSFGVREYIDIQGLKYDPEIGVFGMNFNITLERPGYRLKRRMRLKDKITPKRLVKQEEALSFMKEKFGVEIEEK